MLTRVVKMTFRKEAVKDFLKLFEEVKTRIRAVEGCQHMELLRQKDHPETMFTLSHWDHEQALENYRKSALFADTWKKTKALFADKPEAWSLERIDPASGQKS